MKVSRIAFAAAIVLSITASTGAVAQPGPMPVVSGLTTPGTKTDPDCVVLYMGAGGNFFASAIRHQAENARRRFPKAMVEVRRHQDVRRLPATCRNPLFIGHSMGALRAVKQGNAHARGRVISIDPPNWYPNNGITWQPRVVLTAKVPTVNFFHCPPSPFGCGKVKGARNVDLSKERRGHVRLPYSPLITQEVTR
ncbi:MAG: hypothetical protein E6Q97_28325 [Desulfurellales bacterium]|nr:MAG: hypothetical protein E6Q97_28325 [Desulfurellales bacterium]